MIYRLAITTLCISIWLVSKAKESDHILQPPNEWGTFYRLPKQMADMKELFNAIFKTYTNSKTECPPERASFTKWYKSSLNENHYLFSYWCPLDYGYERGGLKVDLSK